jgi:hypothetical protein
VSHAAIEPASLGAPARGPGDLLSFLHEQLLYPLRQVQDAGARLALYRDAACRLPFWLIDARVAGEGADGWDDLVAAARREEFEFIAIDSEGAAQTSAVRSRFIGDVSTRGRPLPERWA